MTTNIDEHYILHEIEKRGNWTIIIRPPTFAENRLNFEEARRRKVQSIYDHGSIQCL
ncbi:MAG: hypothetical protein ACRD5J_13630 [Nitrososphaeraceae archaeon]